MRSPTKRMPRAKIRRASSAFLLFSISSTRLLRRLLAHALELRELLLRQAVEVGHVADHSFVHQLIDELVAQAVDVHGAAPGEVEERFLEAAPGKRH